MTTTSKGAGMLIKILLPIFTFILGGFASFIFFDTINKTLNFIYKIYCKIRKNIIDIVWFITKGHLFTKKERQYIWENRKNIRTIRNLVVDRLKGKTVKE
jgi:hypothetical protein